MSELVLSSSDSGCWEKVQSVPARVQGVIVCIPGRCHQKHPQQLHRENVRSSADAGQQHVVPALTMVKKGRLGGMSWLARGGTERAGEMFARGERCSHRLTIERELVGLEEGMDGGGGQEGKRGSLACETRP